MFKVASDVLEKRSRIDSVATIIKRVCGTPQSQAFLIARDACVFNVPKRYAGGKTASRKD